MPQSSLWQALKMSALEHGAGVIVSCIKHHSSTAAGRADCSPLLSYHTDQGHWFLRGHLSVSARVHWELCRRFPLASVDLFKLRFLHAQLVSHYMSGVTDKVTHTLTSGRPSPAPIHHAFPSLHPSVRLRSECIHQSIHHSPTSHLPASPDWVRGDVLPHVAPSACSSTEGCRDLIDENIGSERALIMAEYIFRFIGFVVIHESQCRKNWLTCLH